MLVLGMRPNDYILIGDDIMVKVIKSSGDNIRLAIEAPKDVPVVRGDVYERNICKENVEEDKID
jgi:carbon storage regulator